MQSCFIDNSLLEKDKELQLADLDLNKPLKLDLLIAADHYEISWSVITG